MTFLPVDRMWERVNIARQDSDTALFLQLLYFGEMVCKIVVAGLISAIQDDRDRHRYRQLHRVVRADSLGEWASVIEDILTGPASQFLTPTARIEQRDLTQKCKQGSWQYDAVSLLSKCLQQVDQHHEGFQGKADARKWFPMFVQLRNDTRGHGITHGVDCAKLSPSLERSIRLVCESFNLFKRQWAYVYPKLSGDYRVTRFSQSGDEFDSKKLTPSVRLENGIYAFLDGYRKVELITSDAEASDFWFPNGAFNGKRFELISYMSGNKSEADAAPYLAPATELPPSQTQGLGLLDLQGQCFGNIPSMPSGYVNRPQLESELAERLSDDRHNIITLHGSGGIGKTSLALAVLHKIAQTNRFGVMLWFSARDIDLLTDGPKLVKPHVLTESEIAAELVELMQPKEAAESGFQPLSYLSDALTATLLASPSLFVFDNFETVRSPAELFVWIDTYVRQPNKILITTRFRDYKGDFPVEVFGMSEDECAQLCNETASFLRIRKLLTQEYRRDLYRESDGHPYVIKILLGEVAKAGRLQKIERIVASREEILDALFERTFAGLSPAAKQVFLTLSNWRSTVPELAIEAVMLRPSNEKLDIEGALDELKRSSFVETTTSADKNNLLSVPLVAAVFGKRKLKASPLKVAVEANTEILRYLGAAQKADTQRGIGSRVNAMFASIARKVGRSKETLKEYVPIMEFVAQKYPPAWLLLARLFEESAFEDALERAKSAIDRYLESTPKSKEQMYAWQKRVEYCRLTKDWRGEIHSLVEIGSLPEIPFNEVSNSANGLNSLLTFHQFLDIYEIKVLLRKLVETMASRIDEEGDATDCSRLAWLYLRLGEEAEATRLIDQGFKMDSRNEYCMKLRDKLRQGPSSGVN
jgi:tetratricopeptide (TPR) repeat protein